VRAGDPARAVDAQSRSCEIVLGLALPAAAGFALLATPIAAGLFEHGAFGPRDTVAVAAALAAMSAGLPGHALEKILGAVSFAHQDARSPMLAALTGLAVAIAGALALFPHYGHVGVAAAIAASGWVGATLLGTVLWRRGWIGLDRDALRRLPRIAAATILMACALIGAGWIAVPLAGGGLPARIATLLVLVAIGLAAYLASLELLGVARLRDLARAIRHRL
jgi:putative peptidoglycan lipid II flippase